MYPRITVLIVDDHEMLAESLVRMLSEDPEIEVLGHETTGEAGIRRALERPPDVVIMDFVLPDMDGATATYLLRQVLPSVKVITLTGSEKRGAYFATVNAGSSAWVRKSRALQDLRIAVHDVHSGRPVVDDELDELPSLDQLLVHYQPVVDLTTTAIVGFEALVRWNHPERGLLLPEEFLPRAEETGLLADIDEHVRRTASAQLARWQSMRGRDQPLWISVNLSASDLSAADIAVSVVRDIDAAGIDPASFVLEVTETVLIADDAHTLTQLNSLKSQGVGLSLDDFGTGFSSLSYLRRFPFDHLKIDRSFTAELPSSTRSMLLVRSVHDLADTIGMRGIAEGIERADQAEALRDLGWELGQGYFYSRPVAASVCDAMLA